MGESEFSVCQFFEDGSYDYIVRHVDAKSAVEKFAFYTSNVAAKIGITKRVIVTDDGDNINMEWIYDKGYTYPPKLVGMVPKRKLFDGAT